MILGVWWLLTGWFGVIHGTGITFLTWMAGAVILDRRLARREMRRFDSMEGGWSP